MGQRTQLIIQIKTDDTNKVTYSRTVCNYFQWGYGRVMPLSFLGTLLRNYFCDYIVPCYRESYTNDKQVTFEHFTKFTDAFITSRSRDYDKYTISDLSILPVFGGEVEPENNIKEFLTNTKSEISFNTLPENIFNINNIQQYISDNNDGAMFVEIIIDNLYDIQSIKTAFVADVYSDNPEFITVQEYLNNFNNCYSENPESIQSYNNWKNIINSLYTELKITQVTLDEEGYIVFSEEANNSEPVPATGESDL